MPPPLPLRGGNGVGIALGLVAGTGLDITRDAVAVGGTAVALGGTGDKAAVGGTGVALGTTGAAVAMLVWSLFAG